MLYQTSTQAIFSITLFLSGFFYGFFIEIIHLIFKKLNKINFLRHFFCFFSYFFAFFIYFVINLKFNYGEIRFFSIIIYIISLLLQHFLFSNFLAKSISKCYNKMKGRRDEKTKT